jgi:hypothetical protein
MKLRPEVVVLAKALRRKTKAGQRSLRQISAELAARGHLNRDQAVLGRVGDEHAGGPAVALKKLPVTVLAPALNGRPLLSRWPRAARSAESLFYNPPWSGDRVRRGWGHRAHPSSFAG